MFATLKSLYLSDTSKDTTIVFLGTLVNIVIGGLFFVFAPRILGPQDYGIFSTVISSAVLLITIANFGIDTGILRFAKKGSKEFLSVISVAFRAYIILGVSLAFLGFFLAPLIAILIKSESATGLLRIAFMGSTFILLSNFFVASLQAKGEFFKASLVNIVGNTSRLAVLILGLMFFRLDLVWMSMIFFLTPAASIIFGLLALPIKYQSTTTKDALDFFKFNSWIALALIISSVPYDNYFLINLAGPVQTGIYAAPFKILTFVYMFGGNFTRVLASRFSSFDNHKKAITFSLKIMPIVFIFCLAILSTIPFAKVIVSLLFTDTFQGSVPVYQILSAGFIFFFISTIPSSVIIYYLGKSNVSFFITLAKYILIAISMMILVPKYQAIGAAISFSASELLALILMWIYSYLKLRK